jgi:xanthine dehydrogenase accessory factor
VRELLADIDRWRAQGRRVALARVVDLEGSGPRDPGAAMAVNEDGEVVGSVSGGCVEGAVVTEALDVLGSGERRLVTFGYSDDDAFAVGLTCGGIVHLFIEELDGGPGAIGDGLRDAVRAHHPAVLVTIVDGPGTGTEVLLVEGADPVGRLPDPDLHRVALRDAHAALAAGTSSVRHYGACGQANEQVVMVFFDVFAPPPRLIIFGAVDFTSALVRVAKVLGYHVTVCDAREVFATRARFPQADEVVVDWPQRHLAAVGSTLGPRDAVCVLTHDVKFDVPAILAALGTDVGYLGAMGSRRTTEQREERLRSEGIDDDGLARIMAPIGLDLGARTPEETAVAICAEIIALRTGRPVPRLRDGDGPIHR